MQLQNNANNVNANLIGNILISDETSCPLHGRHNPQMTRYWPQGKSTPNIGVAYAALAKAHCSGWTIQLVLLLLTI